MTIGSRYFYSRENEEIIDRQSIQSHQTFLEQVIDRIACVVIGDSNAMQTFGARCCNHIFRAGDAVPGKKRRCMQVDVKRHREKAILKRRLQSQKREGTEQSDIATIELSNLFNCQTNSATPKV